MGACNAVQYTLYVDLIGWEEKECSLVYHKVIALKMTSVMALMMTGSYAGFVFWLDTWLLAIYAR